MEGMRWENCVVHYDEDVLSFFEDYFSNSMRNCIVIGGAGFDPRSTGLIQCLSKFLGDRLAVRLIKEERPDPDPELVLRADKNLKSIEAVCGNLTVSQIEIFASDNAVVGGRKAINSLSDLDVSMHTDVVIDMSALSMGVSFPIVSYIYQMAQAQEGQVNVHLVVQSNPSLDALITSSPNDRVSEVRGFGLRELYGDGENARLWLPQLTEGKLNVLRQIHAEINPHDTCPILPFPSEDPKKGDRVACNAFSTINDEWGDWEIDPRNFVYADERKPLDIYRTILRIDDERKPVFETLGGSIIILSPLGSKIPAIGALMAALERKFPMVYVEALAYNVDWQQVADIKTDESRMAHVWLYGDAYLRDIKADSDHEKSSEI